MYKMRESWTDERMDDFRDDVNRRFDEVDKRFDKFEGEVDRRFDKVDKRFDKVEGEIRDLRLETKRASTASTRGSTPGSTACS
ncbi:MAG: hypothetical protein WDZ46_09830 [Solirubrobacterales bacterium]